MPTLKLELVRKQTEPIIIEAGILGDKEYQVKEVTTETMEEIRALDKAEKNVETLAKQLGILLNVPPEDFKGLDIRRLGIAAAYITDELNKSFELKKE
jgi:hypothetical protein